MRCGRGQVYIESMRAAHQPAAPLEYTMWTCTNDTYCPTADTFATVAEFLAMCQVCFGEQPALTYQPGNSRWVDGSGDAVLVAA